ncbi:hypothetical protein BKA65DRAFT_455214 [Rhexocercosporidium sp. MPI-PUGE-AT-0058]|nr:hypothetical protein BKA65DRAFT_455214 [Rhexocercosporidium sp. MPI-PUGE-AT-0058]
MQPMNASTSRLIGSSPWRKALVNNGCLQTRTQRVVPTNVFRLEKRHNQTRTKSRAKPITSKASPPQQPGNIGRVPNYDYEQNFPPISLLKTAHNSGALPIAPAQVIDFLRDFQAQRQVEPPGWKRRVCLNHDIDPWILGIIAGILDNCERPGQKNLGAILLGIAASFGDRASIFKRVYEATTIRRLQDVPEALQQVGLLAKKGNDPQAMTLLGMALYSQQKEELALEWLRKATSGTLDFPGAAEALVLQGRILMPYDTAGASAAFERAASELEDPKAFFYLSKLQVPGSANHEVFLTLAASSGVLEACHNLGAMEMTKINKGGRRPRSLDDYGLAREWSQIAAEGGFGLSMLNMALMCKSVGEREEGLKWLDRAERKSDVREEAQSLRTRWQIDDLTQN